MRYLLDTNVCIAVMRNHPRVVARLTQLAPADCLISTISAFELLTGVAKCAQPANERRKVECLLQVVSICTFDAAAAEQSAQLRGQLETRGLTIGPYDLLLAGTALSLGAVLVTANTREFSRVSGLELEDWETASSVP